MEHHANIVPWQQLCQRARRRVALPGGGRARRALAGCSSTASWPSGDVKLVAFTHVSNVLGTIMPVAEMVARVRAAGAISLVDGAQACRTCPSTLRALGADFYAWTGHKALGPTGIGVLHGRARDPGGDGAIPDRRRHDRLGRLRGRHLERAALQVRGGHAADRRGGRARRRRGLPGGARHGARARARARADRLHARPSGARCRVCASSGPPERREPRRPGVVHDRGDARPRHRRAGRARGRLRPRRPPLRPAPDALPRGGGHGAGERGRVQRAADIDALVESLHGAARCSRSTNPEPARAEPNGRPVPRLHPRPLQAPAQLRRARPARHRGTRAQPPVRGRAGRAHPA